MSRVRTTNNYPRIILYPDVNELWKEEKSKQGYAAKSNSDFAKFLLERLSIDSTWETSVVESDDEDEDNVVGGEAVAGVDEIIPIIGPGPAECTQETISATEESPNRSVHFRVDPADPSSEPSPKRYFLYFWIRLMFIKFYLK